MWLQGCEGAWTQSGFVSALNELGGEKRPFAH